MTSNFRHPADAARPLVIDLDGTLLRSDLLLETALAYVREYPHRVFDLLWWMMRGKAALKDELSKATDIDVSVLPYNRSVIELIVAARQAGRRIVLATASHHKLACRVADHLSYFDEVIATDRSRNLSARSKRDALVDRFGEQGFDYAGNSTDDIVIWRAAHKAYVVEPDVVTEFRTRFLKNVSSVLRSDSSRVKEWLRALRVHQWLKNLLLFVPLFVSHRFTEPQLALGAVLAFVCFCLCASSAYLLNDLLDLGDDRHHPTKSQRPFAAGRLPVVAALTATPLLLLAGFALAFQQLPPGFSIALAGYYALTLAYSISIKRRMVIDVIGLAVLYTLRVVAGALALGITLSFWLLAFSMFLFLSLALVKRYAELHRVREQGRYQQLRGRGYASSDLPMLAMLGAASGYMSVMVLALYINDPQTATLYRHPELIWLACPLLLAWVTRVWMLTHRGLMNEDPVVFAVTDRKSLVNGLLIAAVFLVAA
jgi:4-hydroxybenzoate polyprenyltransferase